MSKLTNEQRSAILSARAKNRKGMTALLNGEVEMPASVAKHAKALEDWYCKALAPAAKPASKKTASKKTAK
jgi:hypothetical protein